MKCKFVSFVQFFPFSKMTNGENYVKVDDDGDDDEENKTENSQFVQLKKECKD